MNGIVIVIVIFIILIVSSLTLAILKKNAYQGLYYSLQNEDYESFFDRIDAFLSKSFLPIYTRESMRLKAYMQQQQADEVTAQFNRLLKMNIMDYQKNDVFIKAYHYYALLKDSKKCYKILQAMKNVDSQQYPQFQKHYDILFNHSTQYIVELEAEISCHRGQRKGYLEYLLAQSYRIKNNQQKYQYYIEEAAKEYRTGVDDLDRKIQIM